jgi:CRP/FNR family cyclic AMP-dependent transcriptional regulator
MAFAKQSAVTHSIGIPPHPPTENDSRGARGMRWDVAEHESGAVVYEAHDEVRHVYLVKKGRVRLVRPTVGGGRALVALVGVGEAFGYRPDAPSEVGETAVTSGSAEIWSLPASQLATFCEQDSAAAVEIISGFNARVAQLRRRVLGFTAREVPSRLCDTLLGLGDSHGEPCTHGGAVDLRSITQQDLADLVGASRSFVSTLINQMKREGSLGSAGRVLCLRDLDALRDAARREV